MSTAYSSPRSSSPNAAKLCFVVATPVGLRSAFVEGSIAQTRPDAVLILPWNLRKEIMSQLEYIREWGGKLIVPIPEPEILDWPE